MRPDVAIRDVMTREFLGVSEGDDLLITVSLMVEEGASAAVVLRGSEPVGVLTDRCVLRLLAGDVDPETATVADAMMPAGPPVAPDQGLGEAADRLSTRGVGGVLVADGADLVGLVTERDVLSVATLERAAAGEPEVRAMAAVGAGAANDEAATFDAQGICETCGTLSRNLHEVDGQLVCLDCRDV